MGGTGGAVGGEILSKAGLKDFYEYMGKHYEL